MKKRNIILSLVAVISLNGCSAIKARFFKPVDTLTTSKPMTYDFIQPRRALLPAETISRMKLPANAAGPISRFSYYSANGNQCRTISLDTPKAACFVDGRWHETAPVLIAKLP